MPAQRIEKGMSRLLLLAALAFAACQGAPPAANVQKQAGNPFEERLRAMSEGERNAVFIRAIRDSGQDCQHVESSAPGPAVRGTPTWRARCERALSYTIAILPSGAAQVVNDAEARLAGDNEAMANGTETR